MRSTPFKIDASMRLPSELQKKRIQRVLWEGLSDTQREIFVAYYFQDKTILEIAQERGVNKSTVWRNLIRAEARLKKYLQY